MQMKTTMRYQLTLFKWIIIKKQKISVGENVEK